MMDGCKVEGVAEREVWLKSPEIEMNTTMKHFFVVGQQQVQTSGVQKHSFKVSHPGIDHLFLNAEISLLLLEPPHLQFIS